VKEIDHRRELLVQKIDSHRRILALEVQQLIENSPVGHAMALYRQSVSWFQRGDAGAGKWLGRGRSRGLSAWVNLFLSLPILFRLVRRLWSRRSRRQPAEGQ
jgi:hypothetical protein